MKKYKFKFKPYIYVVISLAIVLSLLLIALNIYRLATQRVEGQTGYIGVIVTIIIGIFILVLTVSMLFSSYYSVDSKNFTLRWGVLKNQIEIASITNLVYNPDTKKLTVVFDGENFMVISVVGVDPLDIVDALRAENKKIMFEYVSDTPDKDTKKDK